MRPSTLRLSAAVSLVFTLISFVLAAITLFAGRDAGTLENYAVLRVSCFSNKPDPTCRTRLTGDAMLRSTHPWPQKP